MEKEVAAFVRLDAKRKLVSVTQGGPALGFAKVRGRRAAASAVPREAIRRRWEGGRSRPKGGEEGRRRTRVPGLVTASGSGNPRPDSLGEMAGSGDRRVVGTFHLLLLVAALSLAPRGVSPSAAAWPEEKVRGCFFVVVLERLRSGAGTPASLPRQRGRWGRAAVPSPGTRAPPGARRSRGSASSPGCLGQPRAALETPGGLGDVTGLPWAAV
ncbi:hypothetical protein P7K49_028874 [Saguinus oedipus]|uniref:Uncharacterized protein n=1 Tax=Saguinus oedipus TaxID=9490 RepID=A0ABQ9U6A1_SAGOE|nr:hypothetical protein P7K49_028874 [Saguinus oedipus]